ncbi:MULTISPECIES: M20/M25/M40 family metallo-hydrolase [unclassified Haladaptatus]|uniref:M20 family metallopeptidase n=1 Tax=unclassified Haladaptatus TaxID=2622732 RepID=UPI00209C37A0|nr:MULTISPECIES: M20/M25/M40 family metallo-hydrolase [unclassified Haladaptatus]MCO8244554.1 M20/M25/M40 family metallo-hydrolase [Haladaptatus sp. AB643]MCO8253824.1 M20/M25/M40 family metallo-hydrolase [Haladaptatus sp. AB618]
MTESAEATKTATPAIDPEETISLLQEMVRIPSPYFEEHELSEFVYDWLDSRGLDPEYHHVSEPKITEYEGDNVLARLDGNDPDAPTLLLNAHMDTVLLVEDWEEDPCSGRIEDGKLYGQGACDMKGGLAAVMVAFEALAESEAELAGDVVLSAVVDEEGPYGLGTDRLIRDGYTDDYDAAIVTEPGPILAQEEDIQNPALLLGARGRFLYDIEVKGHAAHGSQPHKGINAVVDAGKVADALSNLDTGSHPKLGDGSVCPLLLEGGSQTLSVPERAHLMVDRHVVLGENEDLVRQQAEDAIDELDIESEVEIGFRESPDPGIKYGPYVTPEDHDLVKSLVGATESVAGVEPEFGYFASVGDFNYLGDRAELPTVIVGPDGENIHGAGEFVYTNEVVEVARIVAEGAMRFVGT